MKTEIRNNLKEGDVIYVIKPLTLRGVRYDVGDTFKINCIIGGDVIQASRGNEIFNLPDYLVIDKFDLVTTSKLNINDLDSNDLDSKLPEDKFSKICDKLHSIYLAKNHDYGNSFDQSLKEFGLVAALVRMNDKFNRLKSLSTKEAEVNESIDDTLLDLANYCIMTYMYRNE